MHSRKNAAGTVVIEEKQGKWRIRLPRSIAKDSARYISTRLDATKENYRKVQRKVFEIEEDIASDNFDVTLERYQFTRVLTLVTHAPTALTVKELWARYSEFKRPQIAATTYVKEYMSRYAHHLANLPTQNVNDAVVIRDYLLHELSPYTAKRVLARLSSCCDWAVDSKLIATNPFKELHLPLCKASASAHEPNPFTREERDAIIAAFSAHPKHKHYLSFVRFLFLTGCRTGEAIGLQWKHVSHDCSTITFCSSYDSSLKIRKTTKTGKTRQFPCNKVLKELLLSLQRGDRSRSSDHCEAFVFTSVTGKPINNMNFTNKIWRSGAGIVTQLVEQGKVDSYRCLYNTRHTFITMALEGGMTIPQVAKLVGNSPQVILEHYAGNVLKFDVPVT